MRIYCGQLIALLLLAAGVWPAFNAETLWIFLSLVLLWSAVQGGIKAASLGIVVAEIGRAHV